MHEHEHELERRRRRRSLLAGCYFPKRTEAY